MTHKAAWGLDPSYIEWAPTAKLGRKGWIAHKSAPSAPPAPDYAGAAQQTAAGNMENLKYQTQANRPTQITPWGTVSWTQNGDNNWVQTTTLSGDQQKALNDQMKIQGNQSALAGQLQGQVAKTMIGGPDTPELGEFTNGVNGVQQNFGGFDDTGVAQLDTNAPQFSKDQAEAAAKAAYGSQMDLIQPQMEQDTTNLDSKLRLQGLQPGTEAYNNAMQNLQRTQAQTRTQAANQSVLAGNQIANQDYQSALAGYGAKVGAQQQDFNQALAGYGADQTAQQASNQASGDANARALQNYQTAYAAAMQNYLQPLNSMNAVLTGQQVAAPQFSNFSQAGYTAGPDMSGAASALGQWNSGVMAQQNANASSQNALLGSALGAGAMFFSDERLKKNIKSLGKTAGGHNWYSWDWKDGRGSGTGVLAQEIQAYMPNAVAMQPNGYLAVDYAQIQ